MGFITDKNNPYNYGVEVEVGVGVEVGMMKVRVYVAEVPLSPQA
jgi:hypothetical protein